MLIANFSQDEYTVRPKSSIQLGGGAKAYPSQFRNKVVHQSSVEFISESTDSKQVPKTHQRNRAMNRSGLQIKSTLQPQDNNKGRYQTRPKTCIDYTNFYGSKPGHTSSLNFTTGAPTKENTMRGSSIQDQTNPFRTSVIPETVVDWYNTNIVGSSTYNPSCNFKQTRSSTETFSQGVK